MLTHINIQLSYCKAKPVSLSCLTVTHSVLILCAVLCLASIYLNIFSLLKPVVVLFCRYLSLAQTLKTAVCYSERRKISRSEPQMKLSDRHKTNIKTQGHPTLTSCVSAVWMSLIFQEFKEISTFLYPVSVFLKYQKAFLHCNTVFMATALQYIKSYYYNLWKMSWKK